MFKTSLSRVARLIRPVVRMRSMTTGVPSMITEKETIKKLLYNIGSRKEVEQYLRMFSSVESHQFAIIKVKMLIGWWCCIDGRFEYTGFSTNFLAKGWFISNCCSWCWSSIKQTVGRTRQLFIIGVEPRYEEGIRITDTQTLAVARQVFHEENLKLVEALEEVGTRARPINGGVFKAEYLDKKKYEYVGKITGINKELIESSIRAEALPILTSLAETEDGQILNVNADVAAGELAKLLQPLKVIYLNEKSGLFHGITGKKIDVINLDEEYELLMQESWVKYGTKLKIREIHDLLMVLPRTSSVSIISAEHLHKELFTHAGAGTLIRRGFKIDRYSEKDMDNLDVQMVKALLESNDPEVISGLQTVEEVITRVKSDKNLKVYADASYDCFAIVSTTHNVPLLEKFVISKTGLMNNVNENVWDAMMADGEKLAWVCSKSSALRPWFFERSDGSYNFNNRTLFWFGLGPHDSIQDFINTMVAIDSTRQTSSFANAPQKQQKRHYSTARTVEKKIGIIGARGYTGRELIRLIDNHPSLKLTHVSSRELAGQKCDYYSKSNVTYSNLGPKQLLEVDPVDCWVMALPNGIAKPFVDSIITQKSHPAIVDLSADYRFNNNWHYGLPELYNSRQEFKKKSIKLIANPGCYATGAQLGLGPLVSNKLISSQPTVFGISGYSGAGTNPSRKNDVDVLKDNLIPYSLTGHIHEGEITHHTKLSSIGGVAFLPHVGSWFQGITLTFSVPLNKNETPERIHQLFLKQYENEPLVKVLDTIPEVRDISGKHHVEIGGFKMATSGNRVSFVVTIDNLLKGAATQCLQNINLVLGLKETAGIIQ